MRYTHNNIRPGRATLLHLPGGVTKIVVSTRQLKSWTPGSFVLLSLPRFGLGQSHPATIASIPSSHEGKLVFFLRAHQGFTSRIHANANTVSLHGPEASPHADSKVSHLVLIDGPYGGKQLDFAAFGSALLIAGSTGVTFTLPVLLDLAFRSSKQRLLVTRVTFIWAVKTVACTSWIGEEVRNANEELGKAGIELSIRVFVTSDEEFVEGGEGRDSSSATAHCECSGECSCIALSPEILPSIEANVLPEEIESQESGNNIANEKSKGQPPVYTGRRAGMVMAMQAGRPDLLEIIREAQSKMGGGQELGVGVCGPAGLTAETRRVVASLEGKGSGIYLHAESLGGENLRGEHLNFSSILSAIED